MKVEMSFTVLPKTHYKYGGNTTCYDFIDTSTGNLALAGGGIYKCPNSLLFVDKLKTSAEVGPLLTRKNGGVRETQE